MKHYGSYQLKKSLTVCFDSILMEFHSNHVVPCYPWNYMVIKKIFWTPELLSPIKLEWHLRGQRVSKCKLICRIRQFKSEFEEASFILCSVLVEFTRSLHFRDARKLILTIFSYREGSWTYLHYR